MKKKFIAVLAFTLPMLIACNDDGETQQPNPDRVAITPTAGIATRAVDATWHKGDEIGIYTVKAGTKTIAENVSNFRYTNSSEDGSSANFNPFDTGNTAYYPQDGSKVDILAYYPYKEASNNDMFIVVDVCDQTSLPAIDLMTAEMVEGKSQEEPEVGLGFVHRLTKLVISVQKDASVSDLDISNATIILKNTPGTAVYDLHAQAFKSFGETVDIELKGGTAIVMPTPANSGVAFTIGVDGKTFNAALPESVGLGSGEEATITITLKSNPETPASVTAMIKPWTGGPTEGVSAIDIDVPQGNIDITDAITVFNLWKTSNEADKRTYRLTDGQWSAAPAPFYKDDVKVQDIFEATTTIGEPDNITTLADELEGTGTVTENGKLSLAFAHIHSQIAFSLALAPGHTADLSGATIGLADYSGFATDGTTYLIDAKDWAGKTVTVKLTGNKKYIGTANFTTQAGKKTVLTVTLDANNEVPASITITAVVGWGTPVDADTEVFIDMAEATHSLGTLPAGTFILESSQGPSATYNYTGDGSTLTPVGDALNWKKLSTGNLHNFTLTYASTEKKPEPDVIVFTATDISWGNQILFRSGQRSNSKFSIELTAGIGYEQSEVDDADITLKGFSTSDYDYPYMDTSGNRNFAIVKEQQSLTAVHTIAITIAGHKYSIDLSKHFTGFAAGKEYILKGTVNKSGLTGITIGTIEDWKTGGTGTGEFEY